MQPSRTAPLRAPRPALELLLVVAVVWLALVAIPVGLGGIGLSWDALNHHMYLGWVAQHPRFDRDFLAAAYQSYQYPYLYWPAFKLYEAGVSGTTAGVVLVSLHVLAAPALWIIARACIPEPGWYGTAMRAVAVALAFTGQLWLSLMDTTINDGLAAVPFAWAVALALAAPARPASGALTRSGAVLLSGVFSGVAVAFKFSNGPLVLLLPLLWLAAAETGRGRLLQVLRGTCASGFGFVLAYGSWGWQLWRHFGNPMFPFADNWFAPLRVLLGWQP